MLLELDCGNTLINIDTHSYDHGAIRGQIPGDFNEDACKLASAEQHIVRPLELAIAISAELQWL